MLKKPSDASFHHLPARVALEERFIKRCKAITERINEEVTEIEGEWLTVADMQRLEFTEWLSLINNGDLMGNGWNLVAYLS